VRLRAAGLVILLLAASGDGLAAASSAAKEKELRELRSRIESLQKGLSSAEESHSEAADALKDSERAISDANRALHDLRRQSRDANRKLTELRAEAREHEVTIKSQQARLGRILYRQYVAGEAEPLKLLLNGEDPARIARNMRYFGYVSRARVELIAGLRANLARVAELTREAAERSGELKKITREQRAQRGRLERERRERNRVLANLSRDIKRQRREIRTLKRDEQRLSRLIEQLTRLVAREPPGRRLRNERVPDASADGKPFPQLKGRLNLPVKGEVEGQFGTPRAGSGTLWKGVFIAARSGDGVKAVAGGRVVFADWLRGFGNIMIIDHGRAYMTLYANNEALYKRVGDRVRGGETIATVGNSGGNPDSGLYFELRHEGKALDPLGWVDVR